MKKNKLATALLALGLVFGIGLFGAAQTANAQQTDKQKTEKKGDGDKNEKKEDSKERKNQDKLMREATVTREQARATALQRVSGEVLEEEIEKENGKLVWAFDIKDSNGKIFDVKVDAKTGAVVSADEDKEDDGDDSGNQTRKDKNVFEKMGSGIKSATARAYRKMTGN